MSVFSHDSGSHQGGYGMNLAPKLQRCCIGGCRHDTNVSNHHHLLCVNSYIIIGPSFQ
ncbi:uncharacterized protein BJ212DRAFT_1349362 [Suillus subaureus]|uniref:Uncharacterized protein n=1 Tax=Suillus subaureus TaxID=48587 RepID=A0A9P7JER4_9AGAM|nr:uncharacterized protein BJ212DRAFT_1349362 [Suillus subaureus]KAG1818185.1 hypothetical protein BJ212DRAFT_1349362 [Suillus subaureus]